MPYSCHIAAPTLQTSTILIAAIGLAVATPRTGARETASAQETATSLQQELKAIEPLVDPSTWLFVRIDTKQLALPRDQGHADIPLPSWLEQAAVTWTPLQRAAQGKPIYVLFMMPQQPLRSSYQIVLPGPKTNWSSIEAQVRRLGLVLRQADSSTIIHPRHFRLNRLPAEDQAVAAETIAAAWNSVPDFPLQCAVALPVYAKRTLADLIPVLPQSLGGESSRWLTHDLKWIAIGVDPARWRFRMVIRSGRPEQVDGVRSGLKHLVGGLPNVVPWLKRTNMIAALENLARRMESRTNGSQWILETPSELSATEVRRSFGPLVTELLERTQLDVTTQRMRQLAVGIHNYYNDHRHLPPPKQHRDRNGLPNLSWRVRILPYVGELDLYRQFRLDEPWDSPHNRKLISRMPSVFRSAGASLQPGYTTFLAVAGKDTVLGDSEPITFRDVTDGTSQTVMVVEVQPDRAVVWTSPLDFTPDKSDPVKHLRRSRSGSIALLFADGWVHRLRTDDYDARQWWALFHRSDRVHVDVPPRR